MRVWHGQILAVALAAVPSWLLAAPPKLEIPAEVKPVQGYVTVEPVTDAASVTYVALDGVFPFPSKLLKDPRTFVLPAGGLKEGRYRFVAVAASKEGDQATAEFTAVIGAPPVPPGPGPGPGPNPPTPPSPVDPLTSFRVILTHESAVPLTQAQFGVMYGKKLEEWLTGNTTKAGDTKGWRRYDKDEKGGSDKAEFNKTWADKPAISSVPVAVVERNGKVQLVPFAADQDKMIEALNTIRGK